MTEEATRPRALITGASSGIGETFARHLARQGHDLILVARRADRLERLAAELSQAHGVGTEVIQADLSKDGDVSAVEARLRSGDIDLLVNGAGFGTLGEFSDLPLERELEELDVNVRALMRLTHAALASMTERGSGGIVNIASTAAFQAIPRMGTYAATKAFVLLFSEAVHEEAKRQGVTVTCLCPGPVRTEFQQVSGVDEGRVPGMAWIGADKVVESALSALRSGKAVAVPGAVSGLGVLAVRLVPRFLARRFAGLWFRRPARS